MRKSTFAAAVLCIKPTHCAGAAPCAIIKIIPVFPEQALLKNTNGIVNVKYDIEYDGTVSQ